MKYTLALLCPPYALWDCGKPWQAALTLLLLVFAISGGNVGVVMSLLFLQTLWALAAVGNKDAYLEAQEFARAVHLYEAKRRF